MRRRTSFALIVVLVWVGVTNAAHAQDPKAGFAPFGAAFDDLVKVKGSPVGVGAVAAGTGNVDGTRSVILRAYDTRGDENFAWGTDGRASLPCSVGEPKLATGSFGDLYVLRGDQIRRLTPTGTPDTAFGDGGVLTIHHPLEEPQPTQSGPYPTTYWTSSSVDLVVDRGRIFVHGIISGPHPQNPRPQYLGWLARADVTGAFDESYSEDGFRDAGGGYCASSELAVSRNHHIFRAGISYGYGCFDYYGGPTFADYGVAGEGPDGISRGADDPDRRVRRLDDLALVNGTRPVMLSSNTYEDGHALSDAKRFVSVGLGDPALEVALTEGGRNRVVGVGSTHGSLDLRSFNRKLAEQSQLSVAAPSGWQVSVTEIVRLKGRYLVAGHAVANGEPGGFAAWVDADGVDP